MTDKRLHFGWFMNFTTNEWNTPFGNDGMPWNGKFYIEMAQAMGDIADQKLPLRRRRLSLLLRGHRVIRDLSEDGAPELRIGLDGGIVDKRGE